MRFRQAAKSKTPEQNGTAFLDSFLGGGNNSSHEPLDESEQEILIREFEVLSMQQHRTWRSIVGGGLLLASLFFAHAAWRQHVDPFGVRFTGELRTVVGGPAGAVATVLALQAAALAAAAAGLLYDMPLRSGQAAEGGTQQRGGAASPARGPRPGRPFSPGQLAALWSGVLGAAAGAAYWGAVLARAAARQHGWHPELAWLPGGPLGGCLTAAWLAGMLADTERELERLRAYRYRFKKA